MRQALLTLLFTVFTQMASAQTAFWITADDSLRNQQNTWMEFFFVENIPSAIEQVASPSEGTGDIYDLNGRLVRTQAEGVDGLMPGIYIKNGNKFVVK